MKYFLHIFNILIAFAISPRLWGAEAHNDLPGLPTALLLQEGEKCLEADSLEERGAAAFNLIVNRYYKNPTDTALRHAAVIALRHLGNLNLTRNIDYRKAYRNLHLARQIAKDDGNDYQLAFILNSLAALYTTNIVDNDSIAAEADRLLAEALRTALRSNNQDLLPTIGINIAQTHFPKGSWDIFDEDIHKIEKVNFESSYAKKGEMVKSIIKATDAFFSNNYKLCEDLLLKVKDSSVANNIYSERADYTFDMFLMRFYLQSSQNEKAISIMKGILDKVRAKNNNQDYELFMYYRLGRTYEDMCETDSAEKYYNKYLNIKEKLRIESGFGEIETLDFLTEIEQANKELESLSIQHQQAQKRFITSISAVIILTILLLALLFIYLNLKRTHRNLFMRNEETLKRERQHRLLREELEKERKMLEQKVNAQHPAEKDIQIQDSESIEIPDDNASEEADEDKAHEEIDDAEKEMYMKLYARILKVMEENSVIFQPNFSMPELASLLHVTPRAVSRAVNICHGSNFPQLLNEYRIREVTRLMHDKESECWTIEAIAEAAGFKNRTSFSRLFKKIIGLTPSEYMKMAKEG